MNSSDVVLTKGFKDHIVENAVTSVKEVDLPLQARSVHLQPIRNLEITIQVLDEKDDRVIETITGKATGGSIKMDSTSLIRRTGNITLSVDPDLFPAPDSLIWFGKVVRVYAGLKDLTQKGEYYNFLLGTFWIDEGGYSIDETKSEIQVSLSDKMTKYSKQLESSMVIPVDVPISEAMKLFMENLGETNFGEISQMDANMVVPYKLEYGVGADATTVITDIRDMYMDCYCGFDLMGNFEFKQIIVQRSDDVSEPKWRFNVESNDRADLTLSFSESYNLKDIKNHLIVYGGTSEVTGITPKGEVRITDPVSPFNVDAIGSRKKIIIEDKYSTDNQCVSKARYDLWQSSNFKEVASISTVPIYIIDAHDILEITHPHTKEVSRYMVDSFELGLDVGSNMSISAHKLYYIGLEYGAAMIPVVENFVKGIYNWGWISLAEERISQAFNISASGQNTLTVRFTEGELGGEQASVTSYATTKNQTMLIDIKDFELLNPASESGANGRTKGDYADRVIGHEMLHAVMNDYLSHDRTIQIPTWFKEGFAEFLHGAKERFTYAYPDKTTNTLKKQALIANAALVIDGAWVGTSEDYVTAYLLAIAVYRLCTPTQWRNLFINLRTQSNLSINFLLKMLPIATTNDEVKNLILGQISSMTPVWTMLFNSTDIDTGSVGGFHFMNLYGTRLDADSVFNNGNATTDSVGFNLKIDK